MIDALLERREYQLCSKACCLVFVLLKQKQHFFFFFPNKMKKIKPSVNQYEKGAIINAKLTLLGGTFFKTVLKK